MSSKQQQLFGDDDLPLPDGGVFVFDGVTITWSDIEERVRLLLDSNGMTEIGSTVVTAS